MRGTTGPTGPPPPKYHIKTEVCPVVERYMAGTTTTVIFELGGGTTARQQRYNRSFMAGLFNPRVSPLGWRLGKRQ